jgi:hypothetical protein
MPSLSQIRAKKAAPWSWLVTAIKNPNLVVVAVFCTIGLLASVNVMLRFPDFGAIIAQYN